MNSYSCCVFFLTEVYHTGVVVTLTGVVITLTDVMMRVTVVYIDVLREMSHG